MLRHDTATSWVKSSQPSFPSPSKSSHLQGGRDQRRRHWQWICELFRVTTKLWRRRLWLCLGSNRIEGPQAPWFVVFIMIGVGLTPKKKLFCWRNKLKVDLWVVLLCRYKTCFMVFELVCFVDKLLRSLIDGLTLSNITHLNLIQMWIFNSNCM